MDQTYNNAENSSQNNSSAGNQHAQHSEQAQHNSNQQQQQSKSNDYVEFENITDKTVDEELGSATGSSKQSATEEQQQQSNQHKNEYGAGAPSIEAEVIDDGVENAEDLATATVSLLEGIRENILAPIYQRQVYALVDAHVLHSVMTKERMRRKNIVVDAYTPEELEAIDKIEEVRLYTSAATYEEKKKEKYTEKWRRFYVSMGWEKKLPPWVSLMITVVVVEGFYAYPIISNWWNERKGKNKKKVEKKPE